MAASTLGLLETMDDVKGDDDGGGGEGGRAEEGGRGAEELSSGAGGAAIGETPTSTLLQQVLDEQDAYLTRFRGVPDPTEPALAAARVGARAAGAGGGGGGGGGGEEEGERPMAEATGAGGAGGVDVTDRGASGWEALPTPVSGGVGAGGVGGILPPPDRGGGTGARQWHVVAAAVRGKEMALEVLPPKMAPAAPQPTSSAVPSMSLSRSMQAHVSPAAGSAAGGGIARRRRRRLTRLAA